MKRLSCALILTLIFCDCISQEVKSQTVRFLFYNVENFFDTKDDSLTLDDDFLPEGRMRWSQSRYNKKVSSVYKVISAAGEWDAPAVVAFCEVEKKSVLQDLIHVTYLDKYGYGIIHEESGDERGIDVCLIYRSDRVKVLSYRYLKPAGLKANEFRTRSVLYSKLLILNDTIHLFMNHWPSRRGGALAGESLRNMISGMVSGQIDSISGSLNYKAKIIVAGDFNCSPEDMIISRLAEGDLRSPGRSELINLSAGPASKGLGTYKYMGVWEMIDQVLVSGYLLRCTNGLYSEAGLFRVFNPGFLLYRDPSYPGNTPFSTYRGLSYKGGFSDHLPLILDLKTR